MTTSPQLAKAQADAHAKIRKAQAGDRVAMSQIVQAYDPFIRSITKYYADRNPDVDFDDLMQEGRLGFTKAIQNYDNAHGAKLSTYGSWWVRAMIQRCVQNYRTRRSAGRPSTQLLSLDAPVHGTDDLKLGDTLEDKGEGPAEICMHGDRRVKLQAVAASFKRLTPAERDVMRERLLDQSVNPMTLEQLARRHGVSRERIRQLEQRLKAKLIERMKRRLRLS